MEIELFCITKEVLSFISKVFPSNSLLGRFDQNIQKKYWKHIQYKLLQTFLKRQKGIVSIVSNLKFLFCRSYSLNTSNVLSSTRNSDLSQYLYFTSKSYLGPLFKSHQSNPSWTESQIHLLHDPYRGRSSLIFDPNCQNPTKYYSCYYHPDAFV